MPMREGSEPAFGGAVEIEWPTDQPAASAGKRSFH